MNPNNEGPVALALTLPYTQRTNAMKVERALFSTSKRLLVENDTVPQVLRTARYRLARKMGTKLEQQLLTTWFPPKKTDSVESGLAVLEGYIQNLDAPRAFRRSTRTNLYTDYSPIHTLRDHALRKEGYLDIFLIVSYRIPQKLVGCSHWPIHGPG
jgi:hypothetical protein